MFWVEVTPPVSSLRVSLALLALVLSERMT